MQISRFVLLLSSVMMASACFATPYRGSAALLPEVRQRLDEAHRSLKDGSWQSAAAYADLVLISDNVSVYVNLEKVGASQRQTCMDALNASFDGWEAALNQTIHFQLESDPAKATIKVTFRPDVWLSGDPVAGLTHWSRKIRSSGGQVESVEFKADVNVRARGLHSENYPVETIRQETEHELGHILGLEDSRHVGDLMGAWDPRHPVDGPQEHEILAVKNLREEARRIKAEAKARDRT